MSDEEYWARVRRAKEYIEAGDVFQVNLTRRFSVQTKAAPLEIYRRLRRVSPSSHAALLTGSEYSIISSSPELFLDLRGDHVLTRPIKGTRPRFDDPLLDESARCDLIESEKDRAEQFRRPAQRIGIFRHFQFAGTVPRPARRSSRYPSYQGHQAAL